MQNEKKTFYVYRHTSPNGMIYIGITKQDPEKRWANGKGYSYNTHFNNAILKYGWENFTHEILYCGLTREEACQKEKELISYYKSNNRKFGYNITEGGNSVAEEMIEKARASKKGKRFTEEHKMALSKAKKGKPWSEKQRESIMSSRKFGENHHMARPVSRYTVDGKYLDTMPYARKYCEILGNPSAYKHICSVCRGKRITAYGYIWKYE